MPPLAARTRPAAGEPEGALVLLHGRGADEHDLYPLLDVLDPEQRLLGVTPRARSSCRRAASTGTGWAASPHPTRRRSTLRAAARGAARGPAGTARPRRPRRLLAGRGDELGGGSGPGRERPAGRDRDVRLPAAGRRVGRSSSTASTASPSVIAHGTLDPVIPSTSAARHATRSPAPARTSPGARARCRTRWILPVLPALRALVQAAVD